MGCTFNTKEEPRDEPGPVHLCRAPGHESQTCLNLLMDPLDFHGLEVGLTGPQEAAFGKAKTSGKKAVKPESV